MSDHRANIAGAPYSQLEWLDAHHAIKSRLRADLICKLPINPGEDVLELGCGAGLWTLLIADRVGLHGTVTGVDMDASAVAVAKTRRQSHVLGKRIYFLEADIHELQLPPESIDVIFLFNVMSYLRRPLDLIKSLLPLLRRNGRLFIKDTDLQTDFFWPVPYNLYSRLMSIIAAAPSRLINGTYNPFFAREIPTLLRNVDGLKISTYSQAFSLFWPLSPEERRYVAANAAMIGAIAAQHGGAEPAEEWGRLFADHEPESVLKKPDFIYSMNEFIFQATLC